MPQTDEVLEFTQLIGPFYEFVDDRVPVENGSVASMKKKSHHSPLVNGTGGGKHQLTHTNGPSQNLLSAGNGPVPSSSPSSSSSSSISSSGKTVRFVTTACTPSSTDVDDFYDDPSDRLPFHHALSSNDETGPNQDAQVRSLQVTAIDRSFFILSRTANLVHNRPPPIPYVFSRMSTVVKMNPIYQCIIRIAAVTISACPCSSHSLFQGITRITRRATPPFVITVHRIRLAIRHRR